MIKYTFSSKTMFLGESILIRNEAGSPVYRIKRNLLWLWYRYSFQSPDGQELLLLTKQFFRPTYLIKRDGVEIARLVKSWTLLKPRFLLLLGSRKIEIGGSTKFGDSFKEYWNEAHLCTFSFQEYGKVIANFKDHSLHVVNSDDALRLLIACFVVLNDCDMMGPG